MRTGVCIEAISTSVRDILQTSKAVVPVAATSQQNEPEPMVIKEVAPAQVPEISAASEVPTSLEAAVSTPTVQINAEPVVARTAYEDAEDELNGVLMILYDLPFLSHDEVQGKIDR